jgi:small subunit ribosomal protein S6
MMPFRPRRTNGDVREHIPRKGGSNMRNYEVVFIANPDLDETALNGLVDRVKGWITDGGGTVTKVDLWGKRRLTYIIRKQREGQYVFITAEMAPSFAIEIERNLRLVETVMRFLITVSE